MNNVALNCPRVQNASERFEPIGSYVELSYAITVQQFY